MNFLSNSQAYVHNKCCSKLKWKNYSNLHVFSVGIIGQIPNNKNIWQTCKRKCIGCVHLISPLLIIFSICWIFLNFSTKFFRSQIWYCIDMNVGSVIIYKGDYPLKKNQCHVQRRHKTWRFLITWTTPLVWRQHWI